MKAYVLNKVSDIRLKETDIKRKKGEVLLKVRAAGICGSDIPRIYKTGAHNMPLIIGHEFSGEVVETEKEDSYLLNKRFTVCPKIPCKKCIMCRAGKENFCTDYDYLGSRRDGGFAEYVSVPKSQLIELPDNVSFSAGAMAEPLSVSLNAVKQGILGAENKDIKICVCGLGTIGLLVSMLLLERGYKNLFLMGKRKGQREIAKKLGIREENISLNMDKQETDFSLYFDCAGTNESVELGIKSLLPKGRLILIGNPSKDMLFKKDDYWQILRKELTLLGIWNSEFKKDWEEAILLLKEKRIDPELLITKRLSIDEVYKGFLIMRDKSEHYTKIMMIN